MWKSIKSSLSRKKSICTKAFSKNWKKLTTHLNLLCENQDEDPSNPINNPRSIDHKNIRGTLNKIASLFTKGKVEAGSLLCKDLEHAMSIGLWE